LKTLNQNFDGYNIDFFEDERESVWMMANAYYKLISDFNRRRNAKEQNQSQQKKKEQRTGSIK
jgi:plasmid segregation protein ParM